MTDDVRFMSDMLEAARIVLDYGALGRDEFMHEPMVRHAVSWNLLVLGEAATRVTAETRAGSPDIPWREIIGFRNVLAHQYHRLSADRMWDVLQDELPSAIAALERRLDDIRREHDTSPGA